MAKEIKTIQVTGIRPCEAYLSSNLETDRAILRIDRDRQNHPNVVALVEKARERGVRIQNVNESYFRKTQHLNHQGVAIETMDNIFFQSPENLEKLILDSQGSPMSFLLLDGITDVRNFGSLIRTAEAMGVSGILIGENNAAPVNDGTIRTSAGAVFSLPLFKFNHLRDAIFFLQSCDFEIVGATEKTNKYSTKAKFHYRTAFVLGNEETGINPSILKVCDHKFAIPMLGETASLNVAVSGAVFIHEFLRQHGN